MPRIRRTGVAINCIEVSLQRGSGSEGERGSSRERAPFHGGSRHKALLGQGGLRTKPAPGQRRTDGARSGQAMSRTALGGWRGRGRPRSVLERQRVRRWGDEACITAASFYPWSAPVTEPEEKVKVLYSSPSPRGTELTDWATWGVYRSPRRRPCPSPRSTELTDWATRSSVVTRNHRCCPIVTVGDDAVALLTVTNYEACVSSARPNARRELRLEAGATQERTL